MLYLGAASLSREFRNSFPTAGGATLARLGVVLWLVAMSTLWMTALTDPGIIPPNPSDDRALPPEGEVRVSYVHYSRTLV